MKFRSQRPPIVSNFFVYKHNADGVTPLKSRKAGEINREIGGWYPVAENEHI